MMVSSNAPAPRALSFAAVAVVCSLTGCAVVQETPVDRSLAHLKAANYELAFQELQGARVDPSDTVYRTVQLAYLLGTGQRLVFEGREGEAMAIYEAVLDRYPGNQVAAQWRRKCMVKLASSAARRGDHARNGGDLEEALLEYAAALEFVADHDGALHGRELVAKELNRRRQRAETHYTQGVRALGEKLWGQTWYHMVNAVEIDPEHEKARVRRDSVALRLEAARLEAARALERSGHYAAALKAYRDLAKDDESSAELAAAIARMEREVEVGEALQRAEMAAMRGEYDAARTLLEDVLDKTEAEQARAAEMMILVRERVLERRLEQASIMELENQIEEALEEYRAIAAEWEGFRDVDALVQDLEATVSAAAAAHQRGVEARDAGDLPAAVEAFEEALLVYPGYKGLEREVAELQARIDAGAEQPPTPSAATPTDPAGNGGGE